MTEIITQDNLELRDQTFTGSLYAQMIHADGRPYHTFRTPTVIINDKIITSGEHLTIEQARQLIQQNR